MNSTTRLLRLSVLAALFAFSFPLVLAARGQPVAASKSTVGGASSPAGSVKNTAKPAAPAASRQALTAKAAAKTAGSANPTQNSSDSTAAARAEAPVTEPTLAQDQGLATAITLYKSHPDASSWQPVWKQLHDLLNNPQATHASVGVILHTNPGLTELAAKVDDAGGGARVWSFPKVADAQGVLVQWQCPVGPPTKTVVGHGRHRTIVFGPAPTVTRLQLISLPPSVVFRDSQIVRSGASAAVKGKPGHAETRALVLTGNERGGNTIWLGAYKLSEGNWVENPAALSAVPPYLVQNISGKASFSGNELVFSLGSGNSSDSETPAAAQASAYKIVLKFVDGKFLVSGKAADEGPSLVVLQFMQAVQHGQLDLARAWLSDPKLIAIAKYAGLLNRPSDRPFKVMAMSAPLFSGERFRLVTFDKTDLIVDVGKVKAQWAIKALYIAPADPVAQKLLGTLPAAEATSDKAAGAK